jgi:hypothetical protein
MYVIVTYKGLALKLWWCGGHLKLWLSHDAGVVWKVFSPLNTELNPICHLLALLGALHILHISRIRRVKFYCKEVKIAGALILKQCS